MSLAVQQNQRKTILIPTIVDDIHAAAVEVALERMGHRPLRWFTSNLPERTTCVMDLNEAGPPDFVIYDYFGEIHASDVDIFWNRRIGKPVIESSLHPSDAGVVKIESERFLTNLLIGFSESSFSVNGYHAAKRAENKAVQLRAAKSAGLAIPPTLITVRAASILTQAADSNLT
ncbi:MAG: hypothetical protein ACK5UX_09700 [Burkholderiales bacterium]